MRNRMGVASHKKALITPTLFSQPSTRPTGEKREKVSSALSRWDVEPVSPRQGGRRAGREGLGSEGLPHPRPKPEPHERRRQIEQIGQGGRILDSGREPLRQ